ncbi:MAG: dTDP-4-amino-4,6-dideoxygalactose transaminase [Deltaproteobacteria bacterium]|nr:dTDP-4-amino-4,6-dideoxygalactose transaminase [Deltaproteobacteria bacterium]
MEKQRSITFNQPCLVGKELVYIADAIKKQHASGDGYYTKACHGFFEEQFSVKKALLTTSCTHALELAAILCDIEPGDEVIVPSFTFTSTVNAFVLRGAIPIFCDVRADTKNIDETLVPQLITRRTKAIVPVHYAGVACEMDSLLQLAKAHGLFLIEDNAQGIFGNYRGQKLGTFGDFGALSFHETKNINCGEGGALFINNPNFVQRAEIIREKGTNRSQFFRGEVDKYGWVDVGSSFLPSDILAAYLWAQLEASTEINNKRKQIWETYYGELRNWAVRLGIGLPFVPEYVEQSYHMFYLVMPDLASRTDFIKHLNKRNIKAVFHYQALHNSPMGLKLGGKPGQCPISEKMSDQLVRLPFYNGLTELELEYICDSIKQFKMRECSTSPKGALAA